MLLTCLIYNYRVSLFVAAVTEEQRIEKWVKFDNKKKLCHVSGFNKFFFYNCFFFSVNEKIDKKADVENFFPSHYIFL